MRYANINVKAAAEYAIKSSGKIEKKKKKKKKKNTEISSLQCHFRNSDTLLCQKAKSWKKMSVKYER